MKRVLLAVSLITALMVVSCDDSIYPDFMLDTDSEAARIEALEIAIDEGDYSYIIKELEGKDYSKMSYRKRYLLQCAWLGKSGFSSIDILSDLLDNPDNINVAALLMGGDSKTLTKDQITDKKGYYAKIVDMNNNHNPDGDNDIRTVAAVSSALGLAMTVTGVATDIPGCGSVDGVSLDKESADYIGKCFEGSATTIAANLDPDELDSYLAVMEDLANSSDLADEGFKTELQDFINEIKASDGKVDADKLVEYLEKAFPTSI